MTKRLYLFFFLAVASSYTTKPISWGIGLQGRVSISPAKMTPLQTGLDTVPTTMEATNDAGRIGIDMTEDFIRNFLISEVEMFGNCGWEIMTISRNHARENICYKCTPIGSNAKPVFLKHSQQIRDGSHNRLRHEFEGADSMA